MKRPPSLRPKIASALSGGGPLGAIYKLGALCALLPEVKDNLGHVVKAAAHKETT